MKYKEYNRNIQLFVSLLYFVVLTGCGVETPIKEPKISWSRDLEIIYEEFVIDAEYYGAELLPKKTVRVVEYSDSNNTNEKSSPLGACVKNKVKNLVIEINPIERISWREILIDSELSSWVLKIVMYHEMGHCFMNKEHTNDPLSIMYPYYNPMLIEVWGESVENFFTERR